MPLVRFEVRNEYGLGGPELRRREAERDDPKALLDGVAVTGLVGILRQLGDLAEFAANVFRDLHEQVTATAGRGRKMLTRIQHIEAALPSIEKAVQAQTSHIHFAYIAGCDWHANVRMEESHLLSSDLPGFMLDSYEECRDPPSLYLLDKFDSTGAGACLKRYSDPSYFKRVWAVSELARTERVPKEKKLQKYKRKGSRLRSREVQHSISITQWSSTTRLASPTTDGQSVSSESIFISDTRLKPENASASTSSDSKTKSNHVNHVFDINPSVMPDEPQSENPSVSNLLIKDCDISASFPCDEPVGDGADDFSQHNIMQEPNVIRLTVTWDEKTEVVKPSSPKSCDDLLVDMVQDLELPEVRCEPLHMDHEIVNFKTEHEVILFDTENLRISASGGNHFDEGASETDNYTDALNTIEPESETDSECQIKQVMKSLHKSTNQGLDPGTRKIEEIAASNLDLSDIEVPIAPNISWNKDVSTKIDNLDHSEGLNCVHTPHVNGFAPIPGFNLGTDHSESKIHDMPTISMVEDLSLAPESSTIRDKTPVNTSKLQDFPPAMLWTNGELLGVEPSKPPDFNSPDTIGGTILCGGPSGASGTFTPAKESISENSFLVERMYVSPNISKSTDQRTLRSDQLTGKVYNVLQPIDTLKSSSICRDNQRDSISFKQNFQKTVQTLQLSDAEKYESAASYGVSPHSDRNDPTTTKYAAPGAGLTNIYNTELSDKSGHTSLRISSSFSGLEPRFLANSLQRKPLLTNADTSMPSERVDIGIRNSEETSVPNKHQEMSNGVASQTSCEPRIRERKERESLRKSIYSSFRYSKQSSPPLEHMKLSFHPMNGSETSKLKLDFSNGNIQESVEDLMFPSFQLLPGPTVPLPDSGSESDDDTFCQSCPYSSEDTLSPRSDSNSELWEQDKRSTNKNHGVCDDSRRVSSSSASVSSFVGFEPINDCRIDPSELGNVAIVNGSMCLPSGHTAVIREPDSIKYLKNRQERGHESIQICPIDWAMQSPNELPPPPPLPPVQWRMMKSIFISGEEENSFLTKNADHLECSQDQRFGASQQQGSNILKPPPITEAIELPNRIHGEQKLNGHTQRNQRINNKENEREELLQQIRNKAFNLRRTAIVKPNFVPHPITNVNVTDMLENANAIQQALAVSDEGGSNDNWSDD